MQDKVAMFQDAHARACASGDRGLAAACAADLQRLGIAPTAASAPMQTATPAAMQTAVPPPPARPKRPRKPAKSSPTAAKPGA